MIIKTQDGIAIQSTRRMGVPQTVTDLQAQVEHALSLRRAAFNGRFQRFSLNGPYQKALAIAWHDYCQLKLREAGGKDN